MNSNANPPKKRGRPSRYRPEYVAKAAALSEFGATRDEIAAFFDISDDTLRAWAAKDSAFADAIKTGADRADQRVVNALYRRATGFERDEQIVTASGAKVTVRKVVDADPRSAALWLANRTSFSLNPRGRSRPVDLGDLDGSAKSISTASFKILEAVAGGVLTSEEAQSAASILTIAAQALKTSALEERLEALEKPRRPAVPAITYKKVENDE
jgi:hypothetical protein